MDPLADPAACARDAPLMAKLGTNVLRVYEVCVCVLNMKILN